MSQKIPLLTLTVSAIGAVSAHRFVGYDGAQVNTVGAKALGVSVSDALDNDDLALDVIGTTVIESGGAFGAGDDLVSDATGAAIVNPAVGGEVVQAHALDAAGGAGEFIEVLLVR